MDRLVISLKSAGNVCNMGCVYCAENKKQCANLEEKISLSEIQKLASLTENYALNVVFHGGEPTLLKSDYYETVMNIFYNRNKNVSFALQTNAYDLDENWIYFLKNNSQRLGLSVSIDGTKYMNYYRVTKNGEKNSFEKVCSNLKLLEMNNISFGMICTINNLSLGNEKELFVFLQGFEKIRFVKLNPCFDKDGDIIPIWAISPMQYSEFVKNFFDIYIRNIKIVKYQVEPILSILKLNQRVESTFCNFSNIKCSNFICLYPGGIITACDNYNMMQLGNINNIDNLEDIISIRNYPIISNEIEGLLLQCKQCSYYDKCMGGCLSIRLRYKECDEYCLSMKDMICHIRGICEKIKNNRRKI